MDFPNTGFTAEFPADVPLMVPLMVLALAAFTALRRRG
jgi:MYXO-CTERM domain-containing protein